jgi:hypothetical protein
MVTIFVPDIPEFAPLIKGARNITTCTVREPLKGYWRIEADGEICFDRKALGLGPALWNSALTGGFRGRIVEYGRTVLRIIDDA